jgi:hypothetical protein
MKKIPQFILKLTEGSRVWSESDAQLINGARSMLLARKGKFTGRAKLASAKFGNVLTPRGDSAIIINYCMKKEGDVMFQIIYFKGSMDELFASK